MDFESSSNKFNKVNAVRRKRIGSFVSSEVVSRQKNADINQVVLNQGKELFEKYISRKQVLDIPVIGSNPMSLTDLPHPSSFSKREKFKSLKVCGKKRTSQMDSYLQLLKRKQTEFNWVYDVAAQEDDESFYEDNLENECNNELSGVVNEAVVPQQLNHPKQFEKKYLVSSTEVRRSSNLEDNESNGIVHNTSSFTYISHVKHEERVVPLNANSDLTATVSRIPDKKTLPSPLKSLSNGFCYEPNFSFGMDDIYDATSQFAVNEGNPNVEGPSKWQQYLSLENENSPSFFNTHGKNIEQPLYEYIGPPLRKRSKYMINKMFHELLVALSGTPGAIFTVNKDTDELEMTKNLPFVHPSETELLDKICKLGGLYRMFENFIEKYSVNLIPVNRILKTETAELEQGLQGQYLHAFCAGLSSVLEPYLQTLIQIEDQVMKDPHIPLSCLHQELEEYFFIFPTLMNVIKKIQTKKVHGCQILELLQKTSYCGVPPIKAAVEKILHTCHGVLYKQLSAWMLHGLLVDGYHEFFIVDKMNTKLKEERKSSEDDDVDGAAMSSNTIMRDVKGNDLIEELQLVENTSENNEGSRIMIVPSMLPSYIPMRVAEKVLFIGQSVQMLKDTENLKAYHYSNRASSILQGRETEFLQTLYQLQKQPHLSIPALEVEIDKIKDCVAEQLWRLVVEEADLMKHLRLLKEMYLLGRGELYLTFVDHAFYLMKGPSSSTVAYDINAAFKQCLAKILTYSEEHESLFSMTLDTSIQNYENEPSFTKTTWDCLRLSYNPPWPLHLLFTESVMEKYSALFMFLLRVRRTQIELQNVWCLQMTSRRKLSKKKPAGVFWGLRSRMAFFVDNLQYYLQVDVLESQFSLLLEKIKKLRDFESIHKSHDSFLITMLQQSFISMKPVLSILHQVLEICMKFCDLLSLNQDNDAELEKALQFTQDFDRQTSLLFKILSSVRSHQTSPHLAQLLLRIDFNKYFTRKSESMV